VTRYVLMKTALTSFDDQHHVMPHEVEYKQHLPAQGIRVISVCRRGMGENMISPVALVHGKARLGGPSSHVSRVKFMRDTRGIMPPIPGAPVCIAYLVCHTIQLHT